jgi:hypothetical protein
LVFVDGLGQVAAGLDALAAVEVTALPAAVLAAELVALDRAQARLAAERVRRLAAFDAADGPQADGAVTTASWLRQACRSGHRDARTQVRVAAALRGLPAVAAALAAGEISLAHAELLAGVLPEVHARLGAVEAAGVEAVLLGLARVESVDVLRTAVRRVVERLDPDGELAKAEREFDRRWLTAAVTDDGLVYLRGLLDREGGAVLLAALEAVTPPPVDGDPQSRQQARADSLVELARRLLDAGTLPRTAAHRPHLTLTVDLPTLQRAAAAMPAPDLPGVDLPGVDLPAAGAAPVDLTGGSGAMDLAGLLAGRAGAALGWTGPIPSASALRLACDATVTRLLLDPAGQPLHLGRSRRVPGAVDRPGGPGRGLYRPGLRAATGVVRGAPRGAVGARWDHRHRQTGPGLPGPPPVQPRGRVDRGPRPGALHPAAARPGHPRERQMGHRTGCPPRTRPRPRPRGLSRGTAASHRGAHGIGLSSRAWFADPNVTFAYVRRRGPEVSRTGGLRRTAQGPRPPYRLAAVGRRSRPGRPRRPGGAAARNPLRGQLRPLGLAQVLVHEPCLRTEWPRGAGRRRPTSR